MCLPYYIRYHLVFFLVNIFFINFDNKLFFSIHIFNNFFFGLFWRWAKVVCPTSKQHWFAIAFLCVCWAVHRRGACLTISTGNLTAPSPAGQCPFRIVSSFQPPCFNDSWEWTIPPPPAWSMSSQSTVIQPKSLYQSVHFLPIYCSSGNNSMLIFSWFSDFGLFK